MFDAAKRVTLQLESCRTLLHSDEGPFDRMIFRGIFRMIRISNEVAVVTLRLIVRQVCLLLTGL